MSAYHYGPPPPAPAPAPAGGGGGYPQFQNQYQSQAGRGAHAGRGGRGGHHASGGGRPDFQPSGGYGYGSGPPPQGQHFGPQGPVQYGSPGPQGGYQPPHAHDYSQGQWQGRGGPHHPPPTPLSAQNYHPNYAQHSYQQQPQGQPQYGPHAPAQFQNGPQQPYGPVYSHQGQPGGPHQPQWNGAGSPPSQQPPYGGGRGGGGSFNGDRGPPPGQVMGPPIRLGFNEGAPHDRAAQAGSSFPPQSYPAPAHGSPYPPAPYQGYPPNGPPHAQSHAGGRHNSRGGNRNGQHGHDHTTKGRHPGGAKIRHRHEKRQAESDATPDTKQQKPDDAQSGKKKKRKTNTLGLTPGGGSDDEDVDEEAKLSELIGNEVTEPDDIGLWLAERRRNFPTRARVEAKLVESTATAGKVEEIVKDAKSLALEKKQQKADKLRRELEKVESSLKRKREQQDAGDEFRDVDGSPSSSSSSSDSDDDDKPEVMSVKRDATESYPPPPRKADPTKHCKYYSTGGICGKKGKCRFVHDSAVRSAALQDREMNGGKMTLRQRLILNDKEQEDLAIVKSLQYLKEKGLMNGHGHSQDKSAARAGGENPLRVSEPSKPPAKSSTLPPPPASGLPAHPPPVAHSSVPTARYQGWNLSGFGNSGVKSEDT